MKIETRIALRYVFNFREFRIISIISFISFLGIVIGVAAILSASSIFNGFREFTENQLIGFDPHIRIEPKSGVHLHNSDNIIKRLKGIKEVKAVSSIISGKLIAIKKSNMIMMKLHGVKQDEFVDVSGIKKKMIVGKFKMLDYQKPYIVIGTGLSDVLRAMPGDDITLMPFKNVEHAIKTLNFQQGNDIRVIGLFQTHNAEYDDSYAYTDYNELKSILNFPDDAVSSIEIRVHDLKKVGEIAEIIKKENHNIQVLTWYDLHRELYNVMQLERVSVFVILTLIIVLAVFNVLASISMTVTEKKRDIGILMAMGAKQSQIGRIFLFESIIIGTLGTILGIALGLLFCYGQIEYGWFSLSASKFLITSIPVSVYFTDVIAVAAVSLGLSYISGIIPSRRASKTPVNENIRFE